MPSQQRPEAHIAWTPRGAIPSQPLQAIATTRHKTRLPYRPNRASSPRNRTRAASPLVSIRGASTDIAAENAFRCGSRAGDTPTIVRNKLKNSRTVGRRRARRFPRRSRPGSAARRRRARAASGGHRRSSCRARLRLPPRANRGRRVRRPVSAPPRPLRNETLPPSRSCKIFTEPLPRSPHPALAPDPTPSPFL